MVKAKERLFFLSGQCSEREINSQRPGFCQERMLVTKFSEDRNVVNEIEIATVIEGLTVLCTLIYIIFYYSSMYSISYIVFL